MSFYLRRNIPGTCSLPMPPLSPVWWLLASSLYKGHRTDCVSPVESQSETSQSLPDWVRLLASNRTGTILPRVPRTVANREI